MLGQITFKFSPEIGSNYLSLTSQDTCISFIVKVACTMEIVKIAKLTNIFGRNPRSDCGQVYSRKRLTVTFISKYMYYCKGRLTWGL